MEISDVHLKLVNDPNDRLRAVCSITFDGEFVVRDLKVVQGPNGIFVAMPSRKLSTHCPKCGHKNHVRAVYCNDCGGKLPPGPRTTGDGMTKTRFHSDVAHPITASFREKIQQRVIEKYQQETDLARDPNYQPVDVDAEFESSEVPESTLREVSKAEHVPPAAPPRRNTNYDFTDYDALIAGLRSGATRTDAGNRPPESSSARSDDDQSEMKSDDRSRGRKAQKNVPHSPKARGGTRESSKPNSEQRTPQHAGNRRLDHQKRKVESSFEKRAEPVSRPAIETREFENSAPTQPVPNEPPKVPASPIDDGDLPFGAGIL